MNTALKVRILELFRNHQDLGVLVRVRTRCGLFSDDIYMGMYANNLEDWLTHKEIRTAIIQGWLKEDKYFNPHGFRKVYLWLDQKMTSHIWYKRVLAKWGSFFRGIWGKSRES